MQGARHLTPWRLFSASTILLSGLAFAASLRGMAFWDDIVLLDGSAIGGGKRLIDAINEPFLGNYFRPLVSVTFFIERFLWGNAPLGYHQTNLLIHMLNTALIAPMLMAAFRDRRVAGLGMALFAFHPVHVSSVAWIGGRTDPLVCLFMTLYAWWLIRAALETGTRSRAFLAGSVLAFFFAMLCKEQVILTAALVPVALRAYGGGDDEPRPYSNRYAYGLYAFAAAVFAYCWWTVAAPEQSPATSTPLDLAMRGGATLFTYCALLLAPSPTWMHAFTLGPAFRLGPSAAVLGYGALLAVSVGAAVSLKRKSPSGLWLCWILLTVAPITNLLPIATLLVAPYRVEVTQIAVAALLAWGGVRLWDLRPRLVPRPLTLGFAGGALAWFFVLSAWGTGKWLGPVEFYGATSRLDPECIFTREGLAGEYVKRGKLAEATTELESLLERLMPGGAWQSERAASAALSPGAPLVRKLRQNQGGCIDPNAWLAGVYAQLGMLRNDTGQVEEGHRYLALAVRLDANNFEGLMGLSRSYFLRNELRRAMVWANIAVQRGPKEPDARSLRGMIHSRLGEWDQARADFASCVRDQPWGGSAYLRLAQAELQLGNRPGAISALERAQRKASKRRDIDALVNALRRGESPSFPEML